MKKIIFICFFCFFTFLSCTGESNLFALIPDEIPMKKKGLTPPPEKTEILYTITRVKIADLKNNRPNVNSELLNDYFNTHKEIDRKQLLKFLNTDENFVIQRNSNIDLGGGIAEPSYRKIFKKKQALGGFYFYGGYFHGEVGSGFGYSLAHIEKDEILYFVLFTRVIDKDFKIFYKLPEIFIQKNGNWYWKNGNSSVEDLYKLMVGHDERLPKEFLEMQSVWENIISNLKIDGKKIEVK